MSRSVSDPKPERILVLVPDSARGREWSARLAEEKFTALAVTTVAELRAGMEDGGGAVVIASELQPEQWASVQQMLQQQPAWSDWPIFVVGRNKGADFPGAHSVRLIPLEQAGASLGPALRAALADRARQYELRQLRAENQQLIQQLEEMQAGAALQCADQTAELRQTIRSLEGFCYTVAHDLRAPLRAMQGLATALLEDYGASLPGDGSDYAKRIVSAAARMDRLIQDLLTYGRLGQMEVTLGRLKLESALDAVLVALAQEVRESGAQIEVARPLPMVWSAQPVVEQVVHHLLANAIKFVAPGTAPRIRVRAEPRENWVRLWVEDNGIGIDPRHHERIFKVFERLHGEETYPGTGIGLAIVKKGMERLSGAFGLESVLGQGSRFWIDFPAEPEALLPPPASAQRGRETGG